MERPSKGQKYIADANVLIDYLESDQKVLALMVYRIGEVIIPTPVFDEVRQINKRKAKALGLTLYEPELGEVLEANENVGTLSFQDLLCFVIARNQKLTCITNDKNLRNKCEETAIPVLWGLEPMIDLVKKNVMTKKKAVSVAEKMHKVNPKYISENIIKRFVTRISSKERR